MQLAEATGLKPHLPPKIDEILKALFAYRNLMFHNGLEWPEDTRAAFEERIQKREWPADWFDKATSGDAVWVFYMSDTFIDHCLASADMLLESFALLTKELFNKCPENLESTK